MQAPPRIRDGAQGDTRLARDFAACRGAGSSDSTWDSWPGLLSPGEPTEGERNPNSRGSKMTELPSSLETEIRGRSGREQTISYTFASLKRYAVPAFSRR